ncbi:DUF1285 domain-containing protein [Altererythrobacter sp. SALINAS58]|uniref:DUF1285 domain-containing protein n=1 Tax=Alteripontixanthobacter muriae TaxID=2705546 RepID=UPI0015757510|nr:DUF1285 domain-containing protein [Alteripontixanthobacter muriae]NTZ41998.1 DUF1285 domain-containing protein [Alteripontixanthobacter muriae]
MPYEPPPEIAGLTLAQVAEQVKARKLPPQEEWSPQQVGDSLMLIAADGKWYYEGSRIERKAMVRAFSSLLMRDEDGGYFLVTPMQKLSVEVEDACFIAVDVARRDGNLVFRLNTDDLVIAGPEHRLKARGDADTPKLYLHARRGCEARLDRSTYQQLAALALEEGDDWNVTSNGETFSLKPQ